VVPFDIQNKFVGQTKNKELLRSFIDGANKRRELLDHVLLEGSPGLGKTTIAHLIAEGIGTPIVTVAGTSLQDCRSITGRLTTITQNGTVLFVDEVHRIGHKVFEAFYEPMDEFRIAATVTQQGKQKTISIPLCRFTMVAATTAGGCLPAAFRSRFGIQMTMENYEPKELVELLLQYSKSLNMQLDKATAQEIALRSRGTPRTAKYLLKRVRDLAGDAPDPFEAMRAMERLGVLEGGLNCTDIKYLQALSDRRTRGIATIAKTTQYDKDALLDNTEPFLIRHKYIEIAANGRRITELGLKTFIKHGEMHDRLWGA
jgi:Holliday junction DNA helicase RuvB